MHPRLWLFALALFPLSAVAQVSAEFIGPESCKACHAEAYQAWKGSKHSRAQESLTAAQQQDARCLSCHAPDLRARELKSVTCESCHGGGQYYSADYVMKDQELVRMVGLVDPSEKDCRSCHDASSPSLTPFDFVEKLKLIDHWTAERERRAAEAAGTTTDKTAKPGTPPAKTP